MYGRGYDTASAVSPSLANAGLGAPGMSPGSASNAPPQGAGPSGKGRGAVMTGILVLGLYVLVSYLGYNERVRESVRPSNIHANLWNLFVVTLLVATGLTFVKWTLAKLVGFGFPGAGSALTFFDNV